MKRLYNRLMKLCADEDNMFFFNDSMTSMQTPIRVFSYHIAKYSDWIKPDALECRGIMFEMKDGKPVRIMARPMEKFFNVGENPMTIGLDMSKMLYFMTKEDGSLISSFEDKGYLGLKSKTSVHSEQAYKAMAWMNGQPELKERVLQLAKDGYTVNFEYCGPDNRIVLGYEESLLRILNIRNIKTGKYVPMDEIFADAILRPHMVDVFDSSECVEGWEEKVRAMTGIEGYILVFEDMMAKLKTDWYVALHHTKDSINNNKRLVECLIENANDDLRGLFSDDKVALQKIADFEKIYVGTLNDWFRIAKTYHSANFHKDRREYAIGASSDAEIKKTPIFSVIMQMYQGLSDEDVIEKLKVLVSKNYDLFIPTRYK